LRRIQLGPEEKKRLQFDRFHHPCPLVQKRSEVIVLRANGLSYEQIADICGITTRTVSSIVRLFKANGVDGLRRVVPNRPRSHLTEYRQTIEDHFRTHPPATIAEAIAAIEKLTGLRRQPTQVRKYLNSIGMKPRRLGMIPAKADPDEQRKFLEQKLQSRIEQAKAGQRVLLFTDAAHFVRGSYLGIVWCFERLFLRGPSGRQRLNVLGALNAITHQLTMVTNDTYINAESFCYLLQMIAKQYAGQVVTVVLDNARYQKCQFVYDMAASLNIELLYLPSYSPNLNLIERLWKFVKKKCLYSKYYGNFADFRATILGCLNEMRGTHRDEIRSLLTLKFQTFENTKPMAA